jgi:gamma-glutamylcyclotransferase (GGCT)/AIG2-like uncharacterized protein YtfP
MTLTDLYFAYGADMDLPGLRARAGGAEVVSTARLMDFRLAFFGHDPVWDSGMETIVVQAGAETWGVLYRLLPAEWDRLDTFHGAALDGAGMYFHYPADVTTPGGVQYQVRTYRKSAQGEPRLPSSEYLKYLIAKAAAHGIPETYQDALRAMPSTLARYPVPRKAPNERRHLPLL